jgi:hypothetical protein
LAPPHRTFIPTKPALTGFTLHKKQDHIYACIRTIPYIISNSMLECHILFFKTQLYFTKIKEKRKRTSEKI